MKWNITVSPELPTDSAFMMNTISRLIYLVSLLLLVTVTKPGMADTQCTMCHATSASNSAHPIASGDKTRETPGPKAPDCTSCHGESLSHLGNPMMASPDLSFNTQKITDNNSEHDPAHTDSSEQAGQWNDQCLGCHQKDARHWKASAHALEDITCSTCHNVHESAGNRPAKVTQTDTCSSCHQKVKKDFLLPSRHPLDGAEMGCTDCHSPHGSLSDSQLIDVSTNATCLTCHEAQRGPFLFDHPPASEDCLSCHKPHGAIHKPLLNSRGPQLCQQCHMANFHPSLLEAGGGLPGNRPSASLLGKNCMNCHPKIHGSSHPSGARLTR